MTNPKRPRATFLYLTSAIVVGSMFVASLLLASSRKRAEAEESNQRKDVQQKGVLVQVATVDKAPATRRVTLTGDVRPFREATLYAKVSGYLKMVNVDKGDPVQKDEVLGVIEAPEVEQQVASKRADLDIKKLTDQRYTSLAKTGLVSQQDRDRAQADVQIANADLMQLKALRGYEVIRAPFAGVITGRHADPGALLQAATSSESALALVDVAEVDRLRIFVYVGQVEAVGIHEGDHVEVTSDEYPDKKIDATITRFSKDLDPKTRTMLTEIDIDNKAAGLLPGIFVHVKFAIAQPPSLIVPADALVLHGGATLVARVVDGHARFVPVDAGNSDGLNVRVRKGLEVGDQVVLHPGDDVAEGAPVRIAKAAGSPKPS
ncbi:MAG TPA: efflux RND transporter periplasmic adaptor subunit [Polyangiaceae bacterium]|jgi:RND family efflux transporter MFP subunit|nr:efflux RND transporter periplasmic adaptor subunit [Polyangiaceae bacterium]